MIAYLIDPFSQTVKEVEYSGDYKEIKAFLDIKGPFTVVMIDPDHNIYLDDEGVYRDGQRFWLFQDYDAPFGGYGLVVGVDPEGEDVAATRPIDSIRASIEWKPALRFKTIRTRTYTAETSLGPTAIVESRAEFVTEN